MVGKLRSIEAQKYYGFISSNGTDYFFHRSAFNGDWNELAMDFQVKEKVMMQFEVGQSLKGPRAENVSRVEE